MVAKTAAEIAKRQMDPHAHRDPLVLRQELTILAELVAALARVVEGHVADRGCHGG